METTVNSECVYYILSYLADKDIINVDTTCKKMAMNRAASKLQQMYRKWVNEKVSADEDPEVYLKRYLPLTLRKQVTSYIRENVIANCMNTMMNRFDEMTYDETTIYTTVRQLCDGSVRKYSTYTELYNGMLSKIPTMIAELDPTIDRTIVVDCLVDDVKCEWILQRKFNIRLTELIDMVHNEETLRYYATTFESQ